MSISKPLAEIESKYWGNSILFQLAEALDRPAKLVGSVENPEKVYEQNPDELLEEALDVIWRYRELDR